MSKQSSKRVVSVAAAGVVLTAIVWLGDGGSGASAQAPARVDYARDVQPIFRSNCYGCHGPTLQNGRLRLDRRRDSMPNRVGANGARIVPGNSSASRVFQRVAGTDAGIQMPPSGALRGEDIDIIRSWIDQGAEWPDDLAGDVPSAPENPQAAQLADAIRMADARTFERVLRGAPQAAGARAAGGSTPLMYAALYRNRGALRALLAARADPNARNDVGATALHWAVDDAAMTKALLASGADPNVRSQDGETPVLLAAARFGAREVVTALLEAGATLKGQGVFARAAAAGDESLMRLLLDRGADPVATAGDVNRAIRAGCSSCIDLLLASVGPEALNQALLAAAVTGDSALVTTLLARGAQPTPEVLRRAAASERIPTVAVTQLLARGVRDAAAFDLARRHGETAVVAVLRAAGITGSIPTSCRDAAADCAESACRAEASACGGAAVAASVRDAIEKSLPLLQRADVGFLEAAGCVSCHNNSLFEMSASAVRPRGFRIDDQVAATQLRTVAAYMESWRERVLQDIPIPGGVDTIGVMLAGLAAAHYPRDPATDALARYLERRQAADGGWRVAADRPPIESSSMAITAWAIRGLRAYAPIPQKDSYQRSIARGVEWLQRQQPTTTEDHVFQLLGSVWAGESASPRRDAAGRLLALQRADGGWGQIPTLPSDAYATGQALTALAQSGAVSPATAAYQRGVRFLLTTQMRDGSWHVRTRAIPVQPYFESGFPHERDQFISAAATNWAVMALAPAVR